MNASAPIFLRGEGGCPQPRQRQDRRDSEGGRELRELEDQKAGGTFVKDEAD